MYSHAVTRRTARRDSSHGAELPARSSFAEGETSMLKSYSYKAAAHWTNHKRGIVEAEAIPRTINFAAPPEYGGEPGLWTPEHLLLAAVSTCYVATLRAMPKRRSSSSTASRYPSKARSRNWKAGLSLPASHCARWARADRPSARESRACMPGLAFARLCHRPGTEDHGGEPGGSPN
jgi:hypothetical protein